MKKVSMPTAAALSGPVDRKWVFVLCVAAQAI